MQYFISGFIFLKTLCFLNAKDNYDSSFFAIWSVVVSFIITSIVKTLDALILPQYEFLPWTEILVCILIGVFAAFVIYWLMNNKHLARLLNKTTRKSINSDIWRDIIDYDLGTILKVFLKNQPIIYIGKLMTHEEKGLDSWFVLKDYICLYTDKDEEFDSSSCPQPTVAAINLNEVERIELLYCEDTDIFN